jgi:hypothetical protein
MLKWFAVGVMAATVLASVRSALILHAASGSRPAPETASFVLLVLAVWLPGAVYLAFGRTGQRCSRFDLVMPLPASKLWLVHLSAVLLSLLLILAGSLGVIELHDWLLERSPKVTLPPGPGALVLPAVACLVLALVVLQGMGPTVYRVPTGRRQIWLIVGSLFGSLALILVLDALPRNVAIVPLAVAAVLAVRGYRALPVSFTLVPREAAPAGTRLRPGVAEARTERWERPVGAGGRLRDRLLLHGRILRILSLGIAPGQILRIPPTLFIVPFLVVWAVFISGGLFRGEVLTAYLLFVILAAPMAQLHLLDPLPISRRVLCAHLLVPGLLITSLGYGIGRIVITARSESTDRVLFQETHRDGFCPPYPLPAAMVRVPTEYCRIAWDGEPPENRSPWGESHEPWGLPVYRGSRAFFYSPYSASEGSSVEFVALQISRAIEAVYGESVAPEEIRERYLDVDPEGKVVPRQAGGLSLLQDYPGWEARPERSQFPFVITEVGLIYFLMAVFYFRFFRATVTDRTRKLVFFGLLGLALILHLAPFVLFITRWIRPLVAIGLTQGLINWSAETLPGGAAASWVLAVLLLIVCYRLAESSFRRIEVPIPRSEQDV